MANDVTVSPFDAKLATASAFAGQFSGKLVEGSDSIPRISLRNSRFRLNQGGKEVAVVQESYIDVIIIASNSSVEREFYATNYDPNGPRKAPDCYSKDGKKPAADARAKQSINCFDCKQNQVGSGKPVGSKQTRACSFKQRIVVVFPQKLDSPKDVYALDVPAQSIFDEGSPADRKFGLKAYSNWLGQKRPQFPDGIPYQMVITRISFDDKATVAKIFFSPQDFVPGDLLSKVKDLADSDEVRAIVAAAAADTDEAPAPAPAPTPTPTPTPTSLADKIKAFDD